jgi:hypothetical protein
VSRSDRLPSCVLCAMPMPKVFTVSGVKMCRACADDMYADREDDRRHKRGYRRPTKYGGAGYED